MTKPYLFMPVKSLLSFSLWLAIGAFLLPACTPLGPSGASSHTWPARGNQYYNYRDAKYLGSDSAEQLSYRLIDSETFFRVKNKGELIDSSRLITVDNTRIQADLQWIRDSSVITGKEYQIYLFIDRTTGLISSLHGEPGTNHDSHPYIESDRNHGTVSPVPADSPRSSSRILIGQVHGHPARPDGITLHRMSPDDSLTAVCLQAPIYAIDAMDGSQGTPGRIHRANPNPGGDFKGQDHDIGKTWGISGPDAGGVFNIGLNALNIWGISHPPYFERLKRIDELYMASQPRHHPDPDFDRGLVNIEGRSVHP